MITEFWRVKDVDEKIEYEVPELVIVRLDAGDPIIVSKGNGETPILPHNQN